MTTTVTAPRTVSPKPATSLRSPRRSLGKALRPSRLLARLAIALVVLVPLFPIYWMVISTLKSPPQLERVPPTWFPANPNVQAFRTVFQVVPFGRSFLNSCFISGVATASVLLTSLMAGFVFSKYRFRGREALFWTLVGTMFVPPIVTLVPLYWLVYHIGLSNSDAGVLLPWLANAFGIFLIRQFMMDVPNELIDAARVDGAGELRVLFRVVTPLLKPALVTLGIFAFVYYWNNFLWPLTILQSTSQYPVVLMLSQLLTYSTAIQYQNVVMAGALLASLPTIVVFFLAQRVFVQGMSRAGING